MTAVADGEIEEGIDERIARGAFEWLVRMYADDSRDRLRTLASTALSTGEHAAGYVTAVAILDELLTVDVSDDPELVDIVWGNGRAPARTRTPACRPIGSIRPPIVGSRPR